MPRLEGFIGASYRSRSIAASNDACINLYAEPVETGKGASPIQLYGSPGTTLLQTLSDFPVRGSTTLNGRTFVVSGSNLYELKTNGTTATLLGLLFGAEGTTPASLQFDGTTLFISVSGKAYYWNVASGINQVDTGQLAGAGIVGIMDGFFLTNVPGTQKFQYSAENDATAWSALDNALKDGYPDNLQAIYVNRRFLWLMGLDTCEAWWLSGGQNSPFTRLQGIFMETGLAAPYSLARINETILWVGRSRRGNGFVWMADSFAPKRISTFAIEYAMKSYGRIDDAVGWAYEENGHSFYVITFPTAVAVGNGQFTSVTWVYDFGTQWWHQRGWLNPTTGNNDALRQWNHTYNFGLHIVGDRENGNLYSQDLGVYTDNSVPIQRLRRSPILQFENKVTTYHRLELYYDSGNGVPQQPAQGSLPQFGLRISRDSGNTWSAEIDVQGGGSGDFGNRVFWGPLGAGRREVFEISSSEPIAHCWIDAILEASPGRT